MIDRTPPGALERPEQIVGIARPERLARLADERWRTACRRRSRPALRTPPPRAPPARTSRVGRGARRTERGRSSGRAPTRSVRYGVNRTRSPIPSCRTRWRSMSSAGPVPTSCKRPGLGRCRGGVEQLAQPLLAGQAPGVQDMVATGDLRAGTERRVNPEPERHRRVPSRVGRRIDDRHHGVDLEVGAAVPMPERPLVDALGSRQAAGVKRGGGVVHGDHGGAAGVGGATRQARRPVGIVEQHDVRGECAERRDEPTTAERDPVAVGGGKPE